ncbi:unnamed protein product [Scytosiphon promiscuus]
MDDAAEYQGIGAGAEGPAGCRPWVGETDDAAEHQSIGLDGESRCLDAFAVALSQAHARREEEGAWYTSTLELQLASVDFCRACRGVPTLHVRVLGGTPPTLWAPRQDEPRQQPWQQNSLSSTTSSASKEHGTHFIPSRVPRVRAASLTCTLGEAALARSGGLESWGYLRLCGRRSWSESQLLEWPQRLRALTLDIEVEVRQHSMSLPPQLQELRLGRRFNHPLSRIVWPASLLRLSFGTGFNPPIAGVVLPAYLQQLEFGDGFNRPIAGVMWPSSLQQLSFGYRFNQPIAQIVWPASLQQLSFGHRFDQPIVGTQWPATLRKLSFGNSFDQPVCGAVLPVSLQHLTFGDSFDQPFWGVFWPAFLQQLSFGSAFNQPIAEIIWPASLQELSFGNRFNQRIAGVVWPASLQRLSFGDSFNQPLTGVTLPYSLQELSVGKRFRQFTPMLGWPVFARIATRDGIKFLKRA